MKPVIRTTGSLRYFCLLDLWIESIAGISDTTEINVLSILIKFSENLSPIIREPVFTYCYLRLLETF